MNILSARHVGSHQVKQPSITPVSNKMYSLDESYICEWEESGAFFSMIIPKGFLFDGASIPRWAWSLTGFRPDGLHRAAALVHDYLYEYDGKVAYSYYLIRKNEWVPCIVPISRERADKLFRELMLEFAVDDTTARIEYWAVRLWGWRYWNGE